jgi:methylthioribose-1-phosphate isomerase
MRSAIKTIFWKDDAVIMIDQKALPHEERHLRFTDYKDVIAAIKDLTVRGAPAIGVAAAMGIALGALHLAASSKEDFTLAFHKICDQFSRTRPTARNLFWAIERMKKRFDEAFPAPMDQINRILVEEAMRICEEDIAINERIGVNGRSLIQDGDNILTHSNAGALATAGCGTALGVVRAAWEEGKKFHVFVDETRPVLQGARLTAWELMREKIPATLIADSMAGFLMKQGKIDKVIVGADRIAANGDVANKIGTYSLAVLAKEHEIPFYVAAPLSTIDVSLQNGDEIPIEERDAEEITTIRGVRLAPEGMHVYNPAFDITPNGYITAIITEAGVVLPPFQESIGEITRHLTRGLAHGD